MRIALENGGWTEIDLKDWKIVQPYRWRRADNKKNQYAVTWVKTDRGWRPLLMHRLLLGARKGECVDHINGEGLNNRRSNLRRVTSGQNLQNRRKPHRLNTSGYRNVYWDQSRRKWLVLLGLNGHMKYFGRYDDKEEANQVATEARHMYMPYSPENAPVM